ncbi:hypothetical protein [Alkalihalobacillus sp. BA299]|nr:hypothetical protein [Alkalihalobacillus sp. BA299]
MTVTVEMRVLEEMEKKIEKLTMEIRELRNNESGFEPLETDLFLTEVYN